MPYYHITAPKLKQEVEGIIDQRKAQRKAFKKILKQLDCEQGYMNESGLHAVVFKDKAEWDRKVWCFWDKKGYGENVLRPRKGKSATEMRELFDTVKAVDREVFHKAMNFEMVIHGGKILQRLAAGSIGKKGSYKYVTYLPDYAVGKIKFPKGVKEITTEQYIKWGGKI